MSPAATGQEGRHLTELDPRDAVRYLRSNTGLTETDLVDGTGASERTVRRWAHDHSQPQTRYQRQIDDLRTIVSVLEPTLTARGIRQWLRSRNRYLDGQRPIDVLRDGRFDRVHEAANAFNDGSYL
jgi:transcriptional regulator with XRE-family HTH domain